MERARYARTGRGRSRCSHQTGAGDVDGTLRPRRTQGDRSLGPPTAVFLQQEVLAVVQAVGAALPELHGVWPEAVAAPAVGGATVREARLDPADSLVKLRARMQDEPCAEAQAPIWAPRGRLAK